MRDSSGLTAVHIAARVSSLTGNERLLRRVLHFADTDQERLEQEAADWCAEQQRKEEEAERDRRARSKRPGKLKPGKLSALAKAVGGE